jgi:hypothetical protein
MNENRLLESSTAEAKAVPGERTAHCGLTIGVSVWLRERCHCDALCCTLTQRANCSVCRGRACNGARKTPAAGKKTSISIGVVQSRLPQRDDKD